MIRFCDQRQCLDHKNGDPQVAVFTAKRRCRVQAHCKIFRQSRSFDLTKIISVKALREFRERFPTRFKKLITRED
jgi:hypothetical protein